jgi:hypothetical protein
MQITDNMLPSCADVAADAVVNCRPVVTCGWIFGCVNSPDGNPPNAFALNIWKDKEDGCSEGRCPDDCPAWDVDEALEWHCGVDIVTNRDAEYGETDSREVYAIASGLFFSYDNDSGSYKLRIWDAAQGRVREYNYTHVADELSFNLYRGEYIVAGTKLGIYGEIGLWGEIAAHIHYVEKFFTPRTDVNPELAYEFLLNRDLLEDTPAVDRYDVPGTYQSIPRYIPITNSGPQASQEGVVYTDPPYRFDPSGASSVRQLIRRVCDISVLNYTATYDADMNTLPNDLNIDSEGEIRGTVQQNTASQTPYPVVITVTEQCTDANGSDSRVSRTRFAWQITDDQ